MEMQKLSYIPVMYWRQYHGITVLRKLTHKEL